METGSLPEVVRQDEALLGLVEEFSKIPQVQAITLGGSHASGTNDEGSDYDIYIYASEEVSLETRKEITDRFCYDVELNNTYWEVEDNGTLSSGTLFDLVYRNLGDIEAHLVEVLEKHKASLGYTTSFWHNIIDSKVLFDRDGSFASMQERFSVPYPEELRQAIIEKNYPLLRDAVPSYANQIKKAVERDDLVSINHRVAAYLASYFDIVFAANFMPSYGEKKLVKILAESEAELPEAMTEDVNKLVQLTDSSLSAHLDMMNERMDAFLVKQGLLGAEDA